MLLPAEASLPLTDMQDTTWRVIEFGGREGLVRLEADWRRLYEQIPLRTSFLAYETMLANVDHLLPRPDQLRCLALTDGRRVRAICVLQPRTDRVLGPPLPIWGVFWHRHGPQADILCADDDARRAVIPAVVAHLRQRARGRLLLIVGSAPTSSPLWDGLAQLPRGTYRVDPRQRVNVLDCSMPFDELRASLSKSFRHKRNTSRNRLAKLTDVRFVTVTSAGDLDSELATFLDVEASGWKGESGTRTAIRCDEERSAFFRALGAGLRGTADYCEITSLYAEGRCLASVFSTRTGATYSCLKIGYDEGFGRVSPGQTLVERMVERCCEDPGIDRFDMVSDFTWVRGWRPDTVPLQLAYVAIGPWPAYPLVASLLRLRFGPARTLVRRLRGAPTAFRRWTATQNPRADGPADSSPGA